MAEQSQSLIREALRRAAAEPAGMPLYGTRAKPGLFVNSAPARLAAESCKQAEYLRVVGTEKRGKTPVEIATITDKGLAYLLNQVNPRPVLEDLVRALQEREQQVGTLVRATHQTQASLDRLRATAEQVLNAVGTSGAAEADGPAPPQPAASDWPTAVLAFMQRWQATHPTEDCTLPELYRAARQAAPAVSVGTFHDGLRTLHERGRIYLHPWTGPLYDIPEPALVLMVGHELAYYASLRR